MADEIKPDVLRRRKGEEGFVVDQDIAWEAAKLTDEEIHRIESRQSSPFDPKDKTKDRIARALGDISVTAATKIVEKDQQVDEANIDGLTHLLNRSSFNKRLEREITRCQRYGKKMVLVLIDMDNLKEVNDKFGHLQGDKVIVNLANLISKEVRQKIDFAGRWGGDEFAIVFPESEVDDIALRIDEMNEAFAKEHKRFKSTVSAGLIGLNPESPKDQTLESLMQSADEALYASKGSGTNKVSGFRNGVIINFSQEISQAKATAA